MIKKPKIYTKDWGREIWWKNIKEYCCKTLELGRGHYCSLHKHILKIESFICQDGEICLALENDNGKIEFFDLVCGDVVDISVGKYHSFYGQRDQNKILEISTQHFESDSYRLFKSGYFYNIQDWKRLVLSIWDNPNSGKCDECGTPIIDRCPRCGAPQCCPKCCEETTGSLQIDPRFPWRLI